MGLGNTYSSHVSTWGRWWPRRLSPTRTRRLSGPGEVRQKLSDGKQFIEALNTLGSELGRAIPFVPALLASLNLAGQIKPVRDLLSYLEDNTGWQWYHMHGSAMGLTASAGLKDVLLRLQALSVPGRSEREWLVNEILPAAFMSDLAGCLLDSDPPICWTKVTNVVIFLDGFEALQRSSASTASQLLHVLATEPRRDGTTDPLLLVVGSRDYLPGMPAQALQDPLAQTTAQDEQEAKARIQQLHTRWQQNLPTQKRHLRSRDLYLTLALHDFGWQDTRSYLSKLDEREQARVFTADDALVETIERVTHGHPLYLALAAEAALEARARGRALQPGDFELAEVSPDIAPGHQDERVRDYLLDLFLRQVSESERKELIYCAVPRFLDPALLRVLLPSLDDMDRQKRWDYYRRLTFVSATGDERVVFHPIVRALLLQLLSGGGPESDERRLHTRLREHFHNLAVNQGQPAAFDWQAQVEEAYHALALGDPQPAIETGITAQQSNLVAWEPLLEAVAQAPVEMMPANTHQRAYDALVLAERHRKARDGIEAVVLYTWLITACKGDQPEVSRLQHNLGNAYWDLPGGDRQTNLEQAIECYEAALQVRTREAYPAQWAMTQNNLGAAYRNLPGGDRQANLERAIECYEAALQVYTREAYPADWATTQNNLGNVYSNLPGGNRQKNLERAIGCFEAALLVSTREAYPAQWAMTQNNLGIAYRNLPGGDRQTNLERAIECYKAALQVYTREAYPANWATTQNNLGAAYSNLSGGDRQTNLERAIECYKAALQVYTREAYPAQWARCRTTWVKPTPSCREGTGRRTWNGRSAATRQRCKCARARPTRRIGP